MAEPFHVIGKDVRPLDSVPKVLGNSGFAADMRAPYMMYGRIVRSSYPRAKVRSIDTSEAEKAGAVCLTYEDVPLKQFNPRLASTDETTYKDWRVLTDEPNYVGEPIAAVAAESEEAAQHAAELIKIDYEVLKPVMDTDESPVGSRVKDWKATNRHSNGAY